MDDISAVWTLGTAVTNKDPNFFDFFLENDPLLGPSLRVLSYIHVSLTLQKFDLFHNGMLLLKFKEFLKMLYIALHCFSQKLFLIIQKKSLQKSFTKCSLFIHDNIITRVAETLRNCPISFNRKYPALILRCSRFTDVLIECSYLKVFSRRCPDGAMPHCLNNS